MRRLATTFLAFGLLLALGAPVAAQEAAPRYVDVVEVKGLIDPIVVDFLTDAVAAAEAEDIEALVLQIDSTGGIVSEREADALAQRIAGSRVPVAAWVGGSGRPRAYGAAYQLMRAADISGVAPGARVGDAPDSVVADDPLGGRRAPRAEALEAGAVDLDAPTLGRFIVDLDGRELAGATLDTAEGTTPNVRPRFSKLPMMARLLHAVSNPWVAYLLFVAGALLVIFELYTAGVGVAAGTGLLSLVPAAYGLAALPTRVSSLVLIGVGLLGYTIDLQAGAPRVWTVIGTLALAAGSVRLYDGLSVPLPVLAIVLGSTALAMVAGMPAMLRTRFSTPTIGRESMIGELGTALGGVDPEGTVEVRGAPWPARTNRATPIEAGAAVRVVGIDGLLLEVEPEEGGARDYRR